jgi:hypothetical protein
MPTDEFSQEPRIHQTEMSKNEIALPYYEFVHEKHVSAASIFECECECEPSENANSV